MYFFEMYLPFSSYNGINKLLQSNNSKIGLSVNNRIKAVNRKEKAQQSANEWLIKSLEWNDLKFHHSQEEVQNKEKNNKNRNKKKVVWSI